jgi:pimeloyl-ACP methyl ester carboxylesterase
MTVGPVPRPRKSEAGWPDGRMAGVPAEPNTPAQPKMIPSSDGVEVALHDFGGDGPPLLVCHATGFHAWCYEPMLRHLTDRYRCLGLDLRGHGDSLTPADLGPGWRGMADDVLVSLEALDLSGVFGVGHSMGGAAIVMAAARQPGSFRAAWLFEPILYPTAAPLHEPERRNHMATAARRRRETFASRDEAYENYATKPPLDQVDPEALRAYVDHGFADTPSGAVTLKCRPEVEAAVFERSDGEAFDALDRVTVPVAVAIGRDTNGPAELAPQAVARLPLGRLEPHPELSHFGPMERPAEVAQRVAAFFAEADV